MSAAEYALRLANGEALEVVLHEVWAAGSNGNDPSDANPFAGETGAE